MGGAGTQRTQPWRGWCQARSPSVRKRWLGVAVCSSRVQRLCPPAAPSRAGSPLRPSRPVRPPIAAQAPLPLPIKLPKRLRGRRPRPVRGAVFASRATCSSTASTRFSAYAGVRQRFHTRQAAVYVVKALLVRHRACTRLKADLQYCCAKNPFTSNPFTARSQPAHAMKWCSCNILCDLCPSKPCLRQVVSQTRHKAALCT